MGGIEDILTKQKSGDAPPWAIWISIVVVSIGVVYAAWFIYNGESLQPARAQTKKELKSIQQKAFKKASKAS